MGSPIYIGNITGEMHSFLERLIYPNITYNAGHGSIFTGKISTGFIYTINGPKLYMKLKNYKAVFNCNKHYLKKLNGTSEFLLSMDTYQFNNSLERGQTSTGSSTRKKTESKIIVKEKFSYENW